MRSTSLLSTNYQSAAAVAAASPPTSTNNLRMDLRSDTITKPTQDMMDFVKQELINSSSNNNVTTSKTFSYQQLLEKEAATLTGKEAALYIPSGTMSNLVALMTHSRMFRVMNNSSTTSTMIKQPEVLVGNLSHIHQWEAGGLSSIGRIYSRQVQTEVSSGHLPLNEIKKNICNSLGDGHRAVTTAVALENTHGDCGGKVLMPAYCEAVSQMLKTNLGSTTIPLHCDGARLWNAAHCINNINRSDNNNSSSAKESLQSLTKHFDSISLCLSKGLGAPVGSVLVGEGRFIEHARRTAEELGGFIDNENDNDNDVVAIAGLYALQNNFERMREDNEHAAMFARSLRRAGFAVQPTESNIVVCNVKTGKSSEFVQLLMERCGVTVQEMDESSIRAALHLGVERKQIEEFEKMIMNDKCLVEFA